MMTPERIAELRVKQREGLSAPTWIIKECLAEIERLQSDCIQYDKEIGRLRAIIIAARMECNGAVSRGLPGAGFASTVGEILYSLEITETNGCKATTEEIKP